MAAPSPESADAACERIRLAFRSWAPGESHPPSREAMLTRGQSNTTLLLAGAQRRWVLRVPRGPAPLGVCREREIAIHRRAAAAGLAPPLRFADAASGILVTDYLPQGTGCGEDTGDASQPGASARHGPRAVADLLRAIHRLIPDTQPERAVGPVLDSVQRLQHWRSALGGADPLVTLGRADRAVLDAASGRLRAPSPAPVLCHNDLLGANRLYCENTLVAIDWEYACAGDRYFDLAAVASEFDDGEARALLRGYLGRPPTTAERQRFRDQQLVYLAISCCWYASQTPRGAAVDAALGALRGRCAAPAAP